MVGVLAGGRWYYEERIYRATAGLFYSDVVPKVLTGRESIELGTLIHSLLPQPDEAVTWDYGADNDGILWEQATETSQRARNRQGLVRINLDGLPIQGWPPFKTELGWRIFLLGRSSDLAPSEIRLSPGDACSGSAFAGCDFDPRDSLMNAQVFWSESCGWKTDGYEIHVYGLFATGRRMTTMVWYRGNSSRGKVSSIVLRISAETSPKDCDFVRRGSSA